MTIQPGQTIGRYKILSPLGRGGMAMVYTARDTRLDITVAIKFIRTSSFPADILRSVVKRFETEARKMAQLSHANIVRVTDYGSYEGMPFLVMEYLPGGTLRQYMGKKMPYPQAIRLVAPVAKALEYAHKHNLIHRDVKPANILLRDTGEPMLSDFGVAKVMDAEQTHGLTGTGTSIGTPEYMAPEQAMGKKIDQRVDIYSLGVILYELITGRRPFTADTPMEVVVKQSRDPLPRPSNFVKGLPQAVEQVLFKALAKDPQERYASMGEFIQALEHLSVAEDKISQEKIEHKRDEVWKPDKTRGVPGWVWVVAGLGLVALIVVIFVSSGGISLKPSSPVKEASSSELSIGSTMVSEKDSMTLMYVPAGEFEMGSNNGNSDENPVHTVILDAFWIDKTEVTNAQYRLCVEAGLCVGPGGDNYGNSNYTDHPVVYVNWNDANNFCGWAKRRLPTEAEWEKAARGTDGRIYPWGNTEPNANILNYNINIEDTTEVGLYLSGASPYGVLDMAGNVWEWVSDWYSSGYYSQAPASNPLGPTSGTYRGLRGGSWFDYAWYVRSANRDGGNPGASPDLIGFRCAMSANN